MRKLWSAPTTPDEVARRAGGRRAYNSWRRDLARVRHIEVLELLWKYGYRHGTQARIARALGVSQATISRDFKAVLPAYRPCPTCDSLVPRERWPDGW